ncbi:MAG: TPM domain-containing protein [Acidobacteria bacterium]|nr:TPM domain-containing protein [Acidobacteriota bacterium]
MSCSWSANVMSRAFVLVTTLLFCAESHAQESYAPWPEPDSGYVTDRAGVLTSSEEERIEQWLIRVETKTEIEIIVVTLRSIADYPGTDNSTIETFATGLFNEWGIGNVPRHDGILLLVAVDDRDVRVELGRGYGENRNADASEIIREVILPQFRNEDYAAGITDGTRAIIEEFTSLRIGFRWDLVLLPVVVVALLLIGMSLLKNGKKGWGWVVIGLALVLLLFFVYLLITLARTKSQYGHSSGWSAGGSGGFGGGSSSGGGASGSW